MNGDPELQRHRCIECDQMWEEASVSPKCPGCGSSKRRKVRVADAIGVVEEITGEQPRSSGSTLFVDRQITEQEKDQIRQCTHVESFSRVRNHKTKIEL